MSLAEATKNLKFDTRLTESNLAKGEMSKEDWAKYLATLPDMASNIETFTIDGKSAPSADDNH